MLVINNIFVKIKYDDFEIKKAILKKYNFKNDLISFEILKRSIDARNGLKYVLKLKLSLKNEKLYKEKYKLDEYKEKSFVIGKKNKKVLVVGYGPAGMFSSLILQKSGCDVTVIERGNDADTRIKDIENYMNNGEFKPKSNIIFGEGGAGMFSDGKLTTGIKSDYIDFIFKTFVKHGANKDILIDSLPHIGSDVLINVCKGIRKEFESLNGRVLFNHKLVDIKNKTAIIEGEENKIEFDYLILAIGHSARDTFYMLNNYLNMTPKQFSMGVRIEHKRIFIDNVQYNGSKELKSATYKLATKINDRGCYSFCMCPGGVVVPANSEENMINVNGMSYFKRDLENSNSALLVDVLPSDFNNELFGGLELQRKYEKLAFELTKSYNPPVQRLEDFLNNKKTERIGSVIPSIKPGYTLANLNLCLPKFVSDTLKGAVLKFDKMLKGFNDPDAILTGIETRSSSPIRILRNEFMQSNIDYIYPIGEGAGYAGGIVSAAVDGIKAAMNIINVKE